MVKTFDFPTLEQLYYSFPRGGALAEGRNHRQGASSMAISTYTRSWSLENLSINTIQRPEIAFMPVQEYSYVIKAQTYCPLATLGDVLRYETLGFWILSFQEILRHLALATDYVKSEYWPDIKQVISDEEPNLINLIDNYLTGCVDKGHWDLDQWQYYVKEHEASASPFGDKWGMILQEPEQMKLSLDKTRKWVENFSVHWLDYVTSGEKNYIYINPELCYPGVRARPADYTILSSGDKDVTVLCKKWRDRKVGGVPGLSQLEAGVYHRPEKKQILKPVYDWAAKTLGCDVHSLAMEAVELFKFLENEENVYCYDLKTAEKQTGLGIEQHLPFATDLGHPNFEGQLSGESYSGIGPTSLMNEMQIVCMLKAILVKHDITPKWIALFSDNFATDVALPKTSHYDEDERFCGFIPAKQGFGPVSLVTDNPKHRLAFKNNRQSQRQNRQYIMRPLLSVIMNNIARWTSCSDFLSYIIAQKSYLDEKDKNDLWIGSWFREMIEDKPELHAGIIDQFPKEVNYVKTWWNVQDTDPTYRSDLAVL